MPSKSTAASENASVSITASCRNYLKYIIRAVVGRDERGRRRGAAAVALAWRVGAPLLGAHGEEKGRKQVCGAGAAKLHFFGAPSCFGRLLLRLQGMASVGAILQDKKRRVEVSRWVGG